MESKDPRDQIVACMQRIYSFSLTTTSGGNISVLDDDGNMWITPKGTDKGRLQPEEIAVVKNDHTFVNTPSSEWPFHKTVYTIRKDIKAIIHAHSRGLIAFALTHKIPETKAFFSAHEECGKIGYCKYKIPGSDELAKLVGEAFSDDEVKCVIMENHGVIVGAHTLLEVFKKFEILEYYTLSILNAKILKKSVQLYPMENIKMECKTIDTFVPTENSAMQRKELIEFAKRSYHQKLLTLGFGEISIRLNDEKYLITPIGKDIDSLKESDIIEMRMNDNGTLSSSIQNVSATNAIHALIYRNFKKVRSIFIASPPNISTFCITRTKFNSKMIPESYIVLRDVENISLDDFMDEKKILSKFGNTTNIILVEHFGAIITGESLLKAFDSLEVMEAIASSVILSHCLVDKVEEMTKDQIDELDAMFFKK